MRFRAAFWATSLLAGSALAGPLAFVTNQPGNSVSVLDLEKGTEIRRLDVAGAPAGVAADSALGIFTVSTEGKVVRRFSREGALLAERALDGGPIGIALDAGRERVFVTDWFNARVWVMDLSLEPLTELSTAAAPAGIVLSPDGGFLVTADRDADSVSIFDAETLAPVGSVKVGIRPFGVSIDDSGRAFTADVGSNTVSVVALQALEIVATIPTGERPYATAFARGKGFVTDQYADTVTVFDLESLEVVDRIDVGEYPEGIDTSPDGRTVVVANWFSNSVSLIDAETLEVTGEIATGDGPRAFGRFVIE